MPWLGIAYDALMLVDRFGRPVKGLRISITPSCDLNCFFCHKEGFNAGSDVIMTPEEIELIVRVAMSLGIDSVKLTGGEPMMRPDILEIVERLGRLGLSDLSMTTNGFKLAELAKDLRMLGLKRVNISFHSTKPERYARITGLRLEEARCRHRRLIEAVEKAVKAGFNPVKLNVVVVKGVNDDELDELVSFAESMSTSSEMVVQLIELVGCGLAQGIMEPHYFDLSRLERLVAERAVKRTVRRLHFRKRYLLPNGVWVEFVKPTGNHLFCMNDIRLRITHDGKLKPCLMRSGNEVEFLSAIRSGASDEELRKLLLKAVELREPFWKPPGSSG